MKRESFWLATAVLLIAGLMPARVSSEDGSQEQPEDREAAELVWPELRICELYLGAWKAIESHYDAGGKLVATVEGTEEVAWVVDKRTIQRRYVSGTRKGVYRAVGMLTWNDLEKKYHGVWFDNVSSTGPSTVKGDWDADSRTLTLAMESAQKDGSTIRYKVEERFVNEQKRVTTTYRVDGDKLTKLLEVNYDRQSVCPSSIRRFFGG